MDGKEISRRIDAYKDFVRRGDIYYAYHIVYRYMSQPFTPYDPNTIFNASGYLLAMLTATKEGGGAKDEVPYNVSKLDIIIALGRLTSSMNLNRMARTVYEKLQQYVLPPNLQEEVDVAALAIRARPFLDNDEYLCTCYRCNQILPSLVSSGDSCPNCFHPFVRSFVSFEPLPLVHFVLSNDLSDADAERIILAGVGKKPRSLNDWSKRPNESSMRSPEVITFNDDIVDVALSAQAMSGLDTKDPFARQLVQIELNGRSSSGKYLPITCDAETLKAFPSEEIFICKRSQHAVGLPIENKYYRLMIPTVGVTLCHKCQHFFHDEEYEFETMRGNGCPLCRYKPMHQSNEDIL